jgi:RHS repeat-associated protein
MSVYFGGRRLWQAPYYSSANGSQGAVFADRLGSNRYVTSSPATVPYYVANYYPYGDAAGTASQDQVGFATYTQDSYTGLDYANQRMYASTYGRFNTPDPHMASAKGVDDPTTPGSWDRYAYVLGDPVNNRDRHGTELEDCPEEGCGDEGGDDGDDGGDDDGGVTWVNRCIALVWGVPYYVCGYSYTGVTVAQQGGALFPQGNPALAAQVAAQAMRAIATTAFSPQCQGFIDGALGDDVLASVQELALITGVVNAATVNAPAGVTLFPNNPALAATQQGTANNATGIQGATLAQYSAASPGTFAYGQFGGNTVFYTSQWANSGSGFALYTMLHEMLHVDGFGDAQIEDAFGISAQTVAALGSTSITYKLMSECGQ